MVGQMARPVKTWYTGPQLSGFYPWGGWGSVNVAVASDKQNSLPGVLKLTSAHQKPCQVDILTVGSTFCTLTPARLCAQITKVRTAITHIALAMYFFITLAYPYIGTLIFFLLQMIMLLSKRLHLSNYSNRQERQLH